MKAFYLLSSRLVLMLGLFVFSMVGSAATMKGMAQVEYGGVNPSNAVKRDALREAEFNALERYVSERSKSHVRMFENKRAEIKQDLDQYILGYKIVHEKKDKTFKKYDVVINAEINTSKLIAKLEEGGSNKANFNGEYISFVFVAREQDSVQQFDTRKVAVKTASERQEAGQLQSYDGSSMEQKASKYAEQRMEVGGSQTQKNDKIVYRVAGATEINTSMVHVFTEAGFEVVEVAFLEAESGGQISLKAFEKDFETGDISGATQSSAFAGLKDLEIPFFAIGTLDIGLYDKDPSTGLARVYVTVTGRVMDTRSRFAKTIASIGPVQFSGTGPNPTVAKNNALSLAAREAASQLTAQMHSK